MSENLDDILEIKPQGEQKKVAEFSNNKNITQNSDEYFCTDCGADVLEDDNICPKCGADLAEVIIVDKVEKAPKKTKADISDNDKMNTHNNMRIISLVCSIIVIISFFLPWLGSSGLWWLQAIGVSLSKANSKVGMFDLVGILFILSPIIANAINLLLLLNNREKKIRLITISFPLIIWICVFLYISSKLESSMIPKDLSGVGVGFILTLIGMIVGLISTIAETEFIGTSKPIKLINDQKYCGHCGSQLTIDATFCGNCGSKVS